MFLGAIQRSNATLECSNPAFKHVRGRIAYSSVSISYDLKIEQRGAMFGTVESKRSYLIDRHSQCFCCWLDFVAAVNGYGLGFRVLPEDRAIVSRQRVRQRGRGSRSKSWISRCGDKKMFLANLTKLHRIEIREHVQSRFTENSTNMNIVLNPQLQPPNS